MAYATLNQVLSELKTEADLTNANSPEVLDDTAYIKNALTFTTKRIDMECQQEFAPRRMKKDFDSTSDQALDPYLNSVILTTPLLDVIQVKVADTVMTEWTPDLPYSDRLNYNYFLYPVHETPHYKLQSTGLYPFWSPFYFSPVAWWPQAAQQAIQVDGLWGYRSNYDTEAWEDSTATVLNSPTLTINGTSLAVADASLFSPGMWIRFTDGTTTPEDEIAEVTDTNPTSTPETVTIVRHQRGTTAKAHNTGTGIDIFIPEPNIQRACLRWTSYLVNRRAVYMKLQVSAGASGSITQVFPQDMPEEIKGILGLYQNFHFAKA